jgi:ADP-ribose pyrophosphatase YjhB (NUDIX family)
MSPLQAVDATVTQAPSFNSTFYTVAVSIIPILYLAVAVQGPLYANLMQTTFRTLLNFASGISPHKEELRRENDGMVFRLFIGMLAGWTAFAILFFGIPCEILGLLSLFWQRQVGTSWFVLLAVVFLTLVVAGGPIASMTKPIVDMVPLMNTVKDQSVLLVVVPIIISNGHVLLVRRATTGPDSDWDFPRGKVDIGETVSAAVIRYSLEVDGLPVSPKRYLGQELDLKTGANFYYISCIPRFDDDDFIAIERVIPLDSRGNAAETAWCGLAELNRRLSGAIFGPVRRYLDTTLNS